MSEYRRLVVVAGTSARRDFRRLSASAELVFREPRRPSAPLGRFAELYTRNPSTPGILRLRVGGFLV
ncbi:MAG: hypothetical protein JO100_00330 [Pseudonocardia sp.]|nr:hypothetical protein [Pseudonocardia sp.]